jgi:hypothetical protein
MYPADVLEDELSRDDLDEEFFSFRREAADCIEYLYGVMGSAVLDVLAQALSGTSPHSFFSPLHMHKIVAGAFRKQHCTG